MISEAVRLIKNNFSGGSSRVLITNFDRYIERLAGAWDVIAIV